MALNIATITDSVAALPISGVNVLSLEQVPTSLTARDVPCLYPEPVGFVSNLSARHVSFDSGAAAPKTVEYDLTYTFCFAPVGSGRLPLEQYGAMVEGAFRVLDAIIANDALSGAMDFQPKSALYFGLVSDPAGAKFHGCQLVFHVREFVN